MKLTDAIHDRVHHLYPFRYRPSLPLEARWDSWHDYFFTSAEGGMVPSVAGRVTNEQNEETKR